MSDEGEKTCPLCAEEMDLTDQQLKPCRCGYEVCVWCWHHIMEMAEKDGTEGRCPACRTPYDKEKIVGTAANCERLVAEVNMEKRHKSQKAKPKTFESRKQLTSVRVIQRNLVYIVGLPLDFADEDLLQSNEYFGQYGKVLKVSISCTSAGTIQQFPNNTCSVYITYARDDEAVRCIQSVHAFILDGRPLRVCFGTTKYCHAWLRNGPCNNPDCLYLHDIGSEEDSFTKDDIVSAYSRVQQITGKTTNMQQRSGNFLPPPTDGYCNYSSSVSRNPSVKSSLNNSVRNVKGSPPSSSSIRSGGLPAAASWGTRASNCNPPTGSLPSTNGFNKQKADATHGLPVIEPIVSNSLEASILPNDVGKRHVLNEETQAMEPEREMEASVKRHLDSNSYGSISEASSTGLAALDVKSTNQTSCSSTAEYNEGEGGSLLNTRYAIDERPLSPCKHEGGSSTADVDIRKSSVGISSTGIDQQSNGECSKALRPDGSTLDTPVSHNDHCLQWPEPERTPALKNLTCETEDDFNNQRLRDAIVGQAPTPASSLLHNLNNLRAPLQQVDTDFTGSYTVNRPIVYNDFNEGLGINVPSASISSNGFMKHLVDHASDQVNSVVNDFQGNHMGPCGAEVAHMERPTLDMGEKHLISNILSLDLDSWGDSLTSQNLAQFFGDNDRHEASLKSANAWKSQISNQSRFSFARQDSRNHIFDFEPTVGNNSHSANSSSFGQGFIDTSLDRHGNGFVYHHSNQELSDNYLGGNTAFPDCKLPVSRSLIAAPPGFTASNRPPPPGFTSHERSDQSLDFLKSGTQLHEIPLFLRNPYQASPSGNISTTNDIEFMDPAILAVGKGRFPMKVNRSGNDTRQNFHIQAGGFENELSNQLMQKSLSPHQGLGYNGVRDNLSPSNNVYGFTSRHMEQSQTNSAASSHFSFQHPRDTVVSNGQWDGWSESQSPNDMGMALRNDRLGLDKFYGGYEDSKFRMTNSGDIYNRSFGI